MAMPKILEEFFKSLTPQQAEELWEYFDGCTNEGIIEIVALIADPSQPKIGFPTKE